MIIKDIILQRKTKGNYNSLFGTLTIKTLNHGTFKFSTVENYEKKILSGIYTIGYTHSPRFGKETLIIKGVHKRSGLRIHPANRGSELEGCVGIGLYNKNQEIPQQIFYSRLAVETLEQVLWNTTTYNYNINIRDIKNEQNNIKDSRSNFTKVA